ncbi:MAG: nitrate reductase [Deltaproteobacteria bacterium]|nr:nitrate reductase [Deltaproteobacteria bacterium]
MTFTAFVEGPLLWIAFLTFLVGSALRLLFFITLSTKKDKPIYHYFSFKWMFLSILRWLLPLNVDIKKTPVFTILGYIFHICLLAVPIFYSAHISLWQESRFGWSWWQMPDSWADWLTLILIGISIFFIIRRIVLAEVRIITTVSDYLLIVACALPFITGYLNTHPDGSAYAWITSALPIYGQYSNLIHILSGELMLILVPFTKLSHWILFFVSRTVIGVEFGRRNYSV